MLRFCCCYASYFSDVHVCFPWQVQSCIQRCDLKCIQVSGVGRAHIAVLLCHSACLHFPQTCLPWCLLSLQLLFYTTQGISDGKVWRQSQTLGLVSYNRTGSKETNWGTGAIQYPLNIRRHFSVVRNRFPNSGTGCPERLCSLHTWRCPKPNWTSLEQPALGNSAMSRGIGLDHVHMWLPALAVPCFWSPFPFQSAPQ